MATVFFSYSHVDEPLRDRLEIHLAMLKRQGVIETWHDRRIAAGDELDGRINTNLDKADLILLLVSPDFLASGYCYDKEMLRAMERHESGGARVMPVILRPCDWHGAPFGKLRATPRDGKPVTRYADLDEAFLEITSDIRQVVGDSEQRVGPAQPKPAKPSGSLVAQVSRSSNLRIRKEFTQADKDRFLDEAFTYIVNFFENSLSELADRNPGIETTFKRIDATQFTANIYRHGQALCRCRIFHGDPASMIGGIAYASGSTMSGGGFNECLSVEVDDQGLFLKPLMDFRGLADSHLTFEGGAEFYWAMFIEPLQR